MIRNLAGQSIGAQMVSAIDGSAFAGTVTVYITIDAGVQAIGTVGSGNCQSEGNGYYSYRPSAAETDGSLIAFTFVGTSAIPATIQVQTITEAQSNALALSTGPLASNAVRFMTIASDVAAMLNIVIDGEALSDAMANQARRFCNRMLSGWSQRGNLFIPIIARERFDLVANQGGPDNPYTIGNGGDFDTDRPSNQNSLVSANLILTATSPEVRVPLGIYTYQSYDANKIPDMSNSQPTGLYYNPTYQANLGSIYLWPVPDVNTNDLELFLQKSVAQFGDLTTVYYLPESAQDAITYQLALRMQGTWGKTLQQEDVRLAAETLGVFKRSNAKLSDLSNDAYLFSQGRRTIYNIQSGSGG